MSQLKPKKQNAIFSFRVVFGLFFGLMLFLAGAQKSQATIAEKINYQGKLTDSSNVTVADGAYDVSFNLYTTAGEGTPVWSESWTDATLWTDTNPSAVARNDGTCGGTGYTRVAYSNTDNEGTLAVGQSIWNMTLKEAAIISAVETGSNYFCLYNPFSTWSSGDDLTNRIYVRSGLFSTMLGSVQSLSAVDFSQTLYLGVTIGTDPEMKPRKVIGSAPSAFTAKTLNNNNSATLTTAAGATLSIGNTTGTVTMLSGGASSWNNTSGNLTVSTTTSGTLAITSAEALNLSSALASTWTLANTTDALNFDSNTLSIDALNNRVGIGTTAPGASLQVVGADSLNTSFAANISGATGTGLVITNAGNVGIGTTSPTTPLYVIGAVSSVADTSFIASASDGTARVQGFKASNTGGYLISGVESSVGGGIYSGSSAYAGVIGVGGTAGAPLQLATNNAIRMTIDYANGNVGIGTTSPTYKLQVAGSLDAQAITINGAPISSVSSQWTTNGTSVYYNSGNVGIGTTAPGSILHIKKDQTAATNLIIENDGVTGSTGILFNNQNGDRGFFSQDVVSADISIGAASPTALVTIKSTGNVGIGTTSPGAKLEISGGQLKMAGTAQILFRDDTAGIYSTATNEISIFTNGGNRLTVNSGGNVGIGTTSPGTQLHIYNNTSSSHQTIEFGGDSMAYSEYKNSDGSLWIGKTRSVGNGLLTGEIANAGVIVMPTNDALQFGTNDTSRITILGSGNVGIGTTAPGTTLDVAGKTKTTNFQMTNGAGNGYFMQSDAAGNGSWVAQSSVPVGNADTVDGVHANSLFNNMGLTHSTYTDFNNIVDFGSRYVQGATNGPGTGSSQFYGFSLGLGSEYALSSYALQLALPRYVSDDKYISMRSREAGTWGAWAKISAGRADNIAGGSTSAIPFQTAANTTGFDASSLIWDNANKRMGIGTTSPGTNLHIYKAAGAGLWLSTAGSGVSGLKITKGDSGNAYIDNSDAYPMYFQIAGSPKMTIDSGGNIGIGTTNPKVQLQLGSVAGLQGNNGGMHLSQNSYYNSGFKYLTTAPANLIEAATSNGDFNFYTAPSGTVDAAITWTSRLTVLNSGNVGIGTTSPTYKLQVAGSLDAQSITINGTPVGSGGSQWTTNGSSIYYNSGNVGIGTTSPQYKLEVNTAVANDQAVRGINIATGGTNYGGVFAAIGSGASVNRALYASASGATINIELTLETLAAAENNYAIYSGALAKSYFAGNIGIGTTSPDASLVIRNTTNVDFKIGPTQEPGNYFLDIRSSYAYGDTANTLGFYFGGTASTNQWLQYTNRGVIGSADDYVSFPNGNVGIGTTAPGAKLDVYSAATGAITNLLIVGSADYGTAAAGARIRLGTQYGDGSSYITSQNPTGNQSTLQLQTQSAASGVLNTGLFINGSGNVGIGTTSPVSPLHVIGNVRFGSAAFPWELQSSGGANQFYLKELTGNNYRFTIDNTGNVGIGTASPESKLHILGVANTYDIITRTPDNVTNNFYINNNGVGYLRAASWAYGSDRRLKENISYINSGGLNKILALKPASFDYINGAKDNLGFIAQEVQQIIPKAVIIADPKTGMLGLKTDFIVPYLVQSIQELNQTITTQVLALTQNQNTLSEQIDLVNSVELKNLLGTMQTLDLTGTIDALKAQDVIFDGRITALEANLNQEKALLLGLEEANENNNEETTDAKTNADALLSGLAFSGPVEFSQATTFRDLAEFFQTVSFNGSVVFKDSLIAEGGMEISGELTVGEDSAGYAIIKEGADRVTVDFANDYRWSPIVNASLSLGEIEDVQVRQATEQLLLVYDIKFIITNITQKGFEIRISEIASADIPFAWTAVSVKAPKTFFQEKVALENVEKATNETVEIGGEIESTEPETPIVEENSLQTGVVTGSSEEVVGSASEQSMSTDPVTTDAPVTSATEEVPAE
jgi:hypothetical protein